MDLDHFIHKWQHAKLKERQGYQEHFRDICDLLGLPTPAEEDTQGEWYCFEYGAAKASGGEGWADVYRKDCFGWEYKQKHKDLKAAYNQLLDYRVSLRNPPLLIVCDFDRFHIYTNFTNSENGCYEFDLATLPEKSALKPELTNFQVLRAAFETPDDLRLSRDPLRITEEAARNIGDIAVRMRARDIPPMAAAHFVMKLIFCLFAEDIGLLPAKPLTTLLKRSHNDFERRTTNKWIAELIAKMDRGGEHYYDTIPEFNGGLFDGSPAIPLENGEALVLERAAESDWSKIEPSIFGTLLERSIDPKRQKQLGAHYTHPSDVMKVIEPVVLDPLREEWFDLRSKLLTPAAGQPKARRKLIEDYLKRLREVRILDPACGSGNFLYLALRAVMDLEDEVRRFAHKEGIPTLTLDRVGPEILLGREIDPYAKELASTVVWIGYIQKRLETGNYDDRPILRPLENIVLADSILSPDGTRPEWPACDYIVGNPPFLGFYRQREAFGVEYYEKLQQAYTGLVEGHSDLCCYFFEQAHEHIKNGKAKKAGLLATSSIRQGDSRAVLDRISSATPMFDVWSDVEWILDGANVRISVICFSDVNALSSIKKIDGEPVNHINSDLSTGVDLTLALPLCENNGMSFLGDLKGGPFDIDIDIAHKMLKAKGNPNGKPNSDVIRLKVNGREFLYPHLKRVYRIDFGPDMSIEEAANYVMPFEYVKEHVYPIRKNNREKGQRDRWWLHMRPRPEMRVAIRGLQRFLATPEVTDHRVFRFLPCEVIPDHMLIVFAFDDWFRFGILQSNSHELWTLALCSSLDDRVRYTPTTTFETFPFPRLSPHLRERYPLLGGRASLPAPADSAEIESDESPEKAFIVEFHISPPRKTKKRERPGTTALPTDAPPISTGGGAGASGGAGATGTGISEAEAAKLIHAVEVAAEELYVARDRVVFSGDPACNSYTALYKAMPSWLMLAHQKLDRAVLACYGLPPDATKEQILEFLLAENLARSG